MKVSFRYLLALVLASLVMQEVHEMSHMLVCRMIGACEGKRYFLFWDTCNTGSGFYNSMIYIAGPVINFAMLWIGYRMLAPGASSIQKSYGATVVLAAIPLQRLQGIVFRGSDEIDAFKELFGTGRPFKGASFLAGSAIILLLVVPPLYRLFLRAMERKALKGFLICLTIPYLIAFGLQKIAFQLGLPLQYHPIAPSIAGWFTWLVLVDALLLIAFFTCAGAIKKIFPSRDTAVYKQ